MATLITDANQLKSKTVRLISQTGNVVIDKMEALLKASEDGMDLVLVQDGDVPVVKLVDFTKFEYQKQKTVKQNKAKKCKTIQFGPHTQENDLKRLAGKAEEFIAEGHPVVISVDVSGRERQFKEIILGQMAKFISMVPTAKPGKMSVSENDKKASYSQSLSGG